MRRSESDYDLHNHGQATPHDGEQALVFELSGNLVTMRITTPFTNEKGLLFIYVLYYKRLYV